MNSLKKIKILIILFITLNCTFSMSQDIETRPITIINPPSSSEECGEYFVWRISLWEWIGKKCVVEPPRH